jgi:hypothetical protein
MNEKLDETAGGSSYYELGSTQRSFKDSKMSIGNKQSSNMKRRASVMGVES